MFNSKHQTIYSTIILKLIYLKELDMLFAISYDDSEVINNVSRQQPFQFIKQTVVIKYNIPSALVESQELLSLTCDFKYFHEVQCSMGSLIAQIYTVVVQRI